MSRSRANATRLRPRSRRARGIGLEAHAVTWSQQRAFEEIFDGRTLVATEGLVERLRRVKEPGEVARIHAACQIADDALAAMLPRLADGVTEREFALELEVAMRQRGASGNSFDPIVASGPNAAKPHARPSARIVEPAELVVLDFGCIVDGYCSDMTRTVSVGDPGDDARHLWDVVRESQWAGREAVRGRRLRRRRPRVPRRDRGRGMGRRVRARNWSRCGPGDPRGAPGRGECP